MDAAPKTEDEWITIIAHTNSRRITQAGRYLEVTIVLAIFDLIIHFELYRLSSPCSRRKHKVDRKSRYFRRRGNLWSSTIKGSTGMREIVVCIISNYRFINRKTILQLKVNK